MRLLIFLFLLFEIPLKSSEKSVLANHEEKMVITLNEGFTVALRQFFNQYGSNTHDSNYKNVEKLASPDFMRQLNAVIEKYSYKSGFRPESINIDIQAQPNSCRMNDSIIFCGVKVFNFDVKWKSMDGKRINKNFYNFFTPYLVLVYKTTESGIRFDGISCFDTINEKVIPCSQ